MNDKGADLPKLTPVANPLNLVPVNLKEAALDSPTFRATTVYFGEQIDAVERWLDAYMKAASRLADEITSIEHLANSYIASAAPPAGLAESVLDQDYTVLALRRYNEGAKEFWSATIKWMKRVESTVVDPIRSFVHKDLASLKNVRRSLETAQKNFDNIVARYASQVRTKESSSLREDAFQLHEARKSYLRVSMDYCVAAPQTRASLDKLLVKIFSDRWREMKNSRDALSGSFSKWSTDIDRVRGWSKEMESHERVFAQELQIARKQIEETALQKFKPPRELDAYSTSSAPFVGNSAPGLGSPKKLPAEASAKQSWLFQKTVTGKPSKTVWVRRWFYVKNGVFGWLSQSARWTSVEESEKIGVLLCGVRPAAQEERRFCFEVKTKNTTLILQAETQAELMEWIAAFEVVKRRALENPAGNRHGIQSSPFAITPPVAAEFAARVAEAPAGEEGIERAATHAVDTGASARPSTDGRRMAAFDKDSDALKGDSTSRLKQKLDQARKGTALQASSTAGPQMGGIASLIAASHSAMPISPNAPPSLSVTTDFKKVLSSTMPLSSLAPSTLANPPAPTTLSRLAIIVGAERGLSLSENDDGGLPGGLMANLWGSTNWAIVNRLERRGLDRDDDQSRQIERSRSPSPRAREAADLPLSDEKQDPFTDMAPLSQIQSAPSRPQDQKASIASLSETSLRPVVEEYPNYYPASLRAQNIQFRMLFPSVHPEDKLVLVFRAAWNPSEQQEFPGRVYITLHDIYFYSNHLGLVLITGIRMQSVSEITAAPGKDCDFLFIHLKDGVTIDGATRITVKTFLEPQRLLQRRLDFLVHNDQSEHPASLEEVIKTLIKMESNTSDDSPIMDSWEDIGADASYGGPAPRRGQDVKTSLHIDGSLDPKKHHRNITKFRLPAHPVEFVPQGFKTPAVERQYDITAKSLFHVLAGDKSAVFQILYCQRGANRLVQGPWLQASQEHHRREIRYEIQNSKRQFEVADYQVIDVMNDHLCYVITERKTAWFLPWSNYFTVVLKIVITHVAKSQSKLSIYSRNDWSTVPVVGRNLIENQASAYTQSYAESLADIVADQASRLGVQGATGARKAMNIFGPVGVQTQSIQLLASDLAPADLKSAKRMRYRSLPRLMGYAFRRALIAYSFAFIGWILQLLEWISKIMAANQVLVVVLWVSVVANFFLASKESWSWWKDQKASNYMARLGVRPNMVMGRSIWVNDMNDIAAGATLSRWGGVDTAPCASAFNDLMSSLDPSISSILVQNDVSLTRPTRNLLSRISRTRQQYGQYRHDLLVALRLVGRMERDMLEAEWEEWIWMESSRCKHAEALLRDKHENATAAMAKWWDGYCPSCIEAAGVLEDLDNGRAATSG